MTIIPISEINVEDFPDLREALENLAGKTDHFIAERSVSGFLRPSRWPSIKLWVSSVRTLSCVCGRVNSKCTLSTTTCT
jgi:hypothetical protein